MGKIELKQAEIKGIKFFYREGFSDMKTFEEVIGRNTYQKPWFQIEKGETWLDAGGNVGAFALLACSKGAKVIVFEPDPFNVSLLKRNLKLNGFEAEVHQAALVSDDRREARMFVGNNNNVWRNSIVKNWNGKGLKVPCLNFDEFIKERSIDGCKMDIEGAEMEILETTQATFKKLVYEWSLDIDPSLNRYRAIIDKHEAQYSKVKPTNNFYKLPDDTLPRSVFPACVNVFCEL